ncbi:hypothetical protein FOA52_004929 [Chlamydomonas sp. UWO 241]|nr:hypothetical protein FOA52_004929 [Chlamydomonas sp. UWO 241]
MLRTILRRKAGQERGRGWCFFMLVALALLAACPLVVLLAGSLCDASTATTSGFCRWQRGTVDSRVEQAPVGAVGGGTQPQATEQKQPQQQQQQAPDKQQEQEPQQGHGDAHSHDTHGVDDIDMPKSDEDIERIMKYPHVNECNLCQVCVLHSAVAKHPKAQERAKEMAHILEVDDLLTDPKMYVISGAKEKAGRDSSSSSSSSAARSLQEEAGHGRRLHELDTIESNGVLEVHGRNIDISAVAPGNTRAPLRVDLPNCTVCWGFVLSILVARGANWFFAGGGRRMDEEEATAAAAERIAATAEDGTSLPVRLATDVVRFLYGGSGRREPADGGVVSASLLNAKPAVGGIGVEPRGGGVLRVLFTVASDAVADIVVRWRHELRRCVDSTAVFNVLSDREEAQHQALWPAFLAAKVAGKRAQFHRARLVVDGERVPAPAC